MTLSQARPTTEPPTAISAQELHETLLKANVIGNQARGKFIRALRAMSEARLFLTLGFSSVVDWFNELIDTGG